MILLIALLPLIYLSRRGGGFRGSVRHNLFLATRENISVWLPLNRSFAVFGGVSLCGLCAGGRRPLGTRSNTPG